MRKENREKRKHKKKRSRDREEREIEIERREERKRDRETREKTEKGDRAKVLSCFRLSIERSYQCLLSRLARSVKSATNVFSCPATRGIEVGDRCFRSFER